MTDLLPPPPGEILLDPLVYGQAEYVAQGESQHPFWFAFGPRHNTMYQKATVASYEVLRASNARLVGMIDEFTASLKEAFSQEEIHRDVAQTFADIFDISLKRSYEYTVNVEYTFSVELGPEDEPADVVNNLNFELSEGFGYDYSLENVDYSISGGADYTEV